MPVGIVSVVHGARCEVLEGLEAVAGPDAATGLPCLLRGRLKQFPTSLAVGDRVEYRRLDDRSGVVERVLERRNQLSRSSRERPRRRSGGPGPEQVVLANPDQVVFVCAARNPGIDFALMDRALALARGSRLPAAICVNKMDLADQEEVGRLLRPYERLGIPVLFASAEERLGLDALSELLKGKLSFFWGGSGVGKSSLIRALTGREVKVGRWRTDNPRGPHTTNVTRLYPLPGSGLIADTPGFDWLELDTVDTGPDPTEALLPEAVPLRKLCRFPACTHCGEPGCAVMAAVLAGEIDRSRYARFRVERRETQPPKRFPAELIVDGEDLLFKMREGNVSIWATLQLYYLFQEWRPEREGFLRALEVPPGAGEPLWVVFQHELIGGASSRAVVTARVTSTVPVEEILQQGQELILRERGVVKAVGEVREVIPAADTWHLRKALRHSPIYDHHAFWSDLKPPKDEPVPPLHAALVRIGRLDLFETLPELAVGAVTAQEIGTVLDFLEAGSPEDELAYQ